MKESRIIPNMPDIAPVKRILRDAIAVHQYTLDGKYVKTFASQGEAARELGKKSSAAISSCSSGKIKTAFGFQWRKSSI